MAENEFVNKIKEGANSWNAWRSRTEMIPNLSDVNLVGLDLKEIDLSDANLDGAILNDANMEGAVLARASLFTTQLIHVNLTGASLEDANLDATSLMRSNLTSAEMSGARFNGGDAAKANFSNATLMHTTLIGTGLWNADFDQAVLGDTVFADVNLSGVTGLESCRHIGPSAIDFRTLRQSKSLPLAFLRGSGLPDSFIDYLPSMLNQAIRYYSCFLSFSTKDQDFASRVHSDLQDGGIRCWFAPHDLMIGAKILDEIDVAIRLRDKVVLILSEHSIRSEWVEDEVTKAFEEERKRGQIVLFPIRLDDAVMDTDEAWAAKLRARHIGDFTRWKDHDEYQKSFARVLRDLTVKKP